MSSTGQHLGYLKKANDVLRMQNHVPTAVLKSLIRSLPSDMVNDTVKSTQFTFEDALTELSYGGGPHTDLFHDVTCAFFREKDR